MSLWNELANQHQGLRHVITFVYSRENKQTVTITVKCQIIYFAEYGY